MPPIQNYLVENTESGTNLEFIGRLLGFGTPIPADSDFDCNVRLYQKLSQGFPKSEQYVGSTTLYNKGKIIKKLYICSDSFDEVVMWFFSLNENPFLRDFHVVSALKDAVVFALKYDDMSYELQGYFQELRNRL